MIRIRLITSLGIILSLIAILFGPPQSVVFAAALLNKSDTMSSLKISTAANHTIVFRTPTGASEGTDTITVTFPSGWTMNTVDFADIDLAHSAGSQSNCTNPTYSNDETLAAASSITAWGATLSGQAISIVAPTDGTGVAAIAANACVRIKIGTNASTGVAGDTQITNSATAGNHTVAIAGTFGDSGDILVSLLSDDQVAVSATVDESLTFSISDNSIGFGTLSATDDFFANGAGTGSATEAEAHNIVVGTNASNGYTMTVTGSSLTSGGYTITAIGGTNTVSSFGTEQFGIRATATGGSGIVSAPYAAAGFALDTMAFPDELATAVGSSLSTTYSMRYVANISATTEAASYTSTLTYTSTANF